MDQRLMPLLPYDDGPWLASELDLRGIGKDARRRLLTTGAIVRSRKGVFVRPSGPPQRSAAELADGLLAAHVRLTQGKQDPAYLYSHTSAARLHRLIFLRDSPLIHVSCHSKPCARRLGSGVRAHFIPVPEPDRLALHGVPTTSLERTIIDCARILPAEDALVLADQALALGADRRIMIERLKGMVGHRGVVNARRVVELGDPRSESVAETRARLMFHQENLPRPVLQLKVMTALGRRFLDFAWPEEMLAVEFDGMVKYFGAKPTDKALYEERLRERQLMELGWRFVRLTWADLENPTEVRRRIKAALSGNGPFRTTVRSS